MAKRPVFIANNKAPFYDVIDIEFTYNHGFAVVQKRKNILALHEAYRLLYNDDPLEISTKSFQQEGIALSAFNLKKRVVSLGKSIPVECIYQSSKVFKEGGPFIDLLLKSPKEAKKDERLRTSGRFVTYFLEDKEYAPYPASCFYDWLYINALLENPSLSEQLRSYNSFTDIEFNPNKSQNCQAHAAAVFISLHKNNLLHLTRDYVTFKNLLKIDKQFDKSHHLLKGEEIK